MKNQTKIYIIFSIFISISLLLIIFFIWPLFKEIKKSSEDLIFIKNSMATLNIQAAETENFKENYKERYEPGLEKIDQLFVDSDNPVDFIKFLEEMASNSGITSKISLQQSPSELKEFIVFQFFSEGDFFGILSFSEKIENGPYLIEIENLIFEDYLSENYSSDKTTANFTIKVFTKK